MTLRIDWNAIDAAIPLRVVCAWCGHPIRDGREPTSHGICTSCYDKALNSIYSASTASPVELPRFCARCNHVHTTNAERAFCSQQEDQ
jgi:hypothetical protein